MTFSYKGYKTVTIIEHTKERFCRRRAAVVNAGLVQDSTFVKK